MAHPGQARARGISTYRKDGQLFAQPLRNPGRWKWTTYPPLLYRTLISNKSPTAIVRGPAGFDEEDERLTERFLVAEYREPGEAADC